MMMHLLMMQGDVGKTEQPAAGGLSSTWASQPDSLRVLQELVENHVATADNAVLAFIHALALRRTDCMLFLYNSHPDVLFQARLT